MNFMFQLEFRNPKFISAIRRLPQPQPRRRSRGFRKLAGSRTHLFVRTNCWPERD